MRIAKQLTSQHKYEQWNFNGIVPGPFIRARVGDVVELIKTWVMEPKSRGLGLAFFCCRQRRTPSRPYKRVASTKTKQLTSQHKYEQWNFNGIVPGPFIRARVGDVVLVWPSSAVVSAEPPPGPINAWQSILCGLPALSNIDCHAFIGPGGGSALTTAEEGQTKTARFRLHYPGLYLYHCAAVAGFVAVRQR
jgi:FtsP/CotA-like multicopper oxidase with cupredoxin domain